MVVERVAYVDESYREQAGGGFHVLAAAVWMTRWTFLVARSPMLVG